MDKSNNSSINNISNGEKIIKDNYENDKTIKKDGEEDKKKINNKDLSNSQLKIMELKENLKVNTNQNLLLDKLIIELSRGDLNDAV